MSEKHTQPYSACYDLTDLTTCVYAVVMMTMMLMICCIQQRQERFTDCSALLELERKVNASLHRCCCCCLSFICVTTATPAVCWRSLLSPSLHLNHFLTCFHSPFMALLLLLYITPPFPFPHTLPHVSPGIIRTGGCWSGEWQSWRRSWRWGDFLIVATDTLHASAWLAWL